MDVKRILYCLESGVASHADIDKAVELGLNHPMGPFRLGDLKRGDLGRKTGRGFYDYSVDPPRPILD